MKSHAELLRAKVSYVWNRFTHNPQGVKGDEIHADLPKPRLSHV